MVAVVELELESVIAAALVSPRSLAAAAAAGRQVSTRTNPSTREP